MPQFYNWGIFQTSAKGSGTQIKSSSFTSWRKKKSVFMTDGWDGWNFGDKVIRMEGYSQRKNSICGLLSSSWLWPNINLTEQKFMVENTTERLKLSRNDRGCKMVGPFEVLKRAQLILKLKLIWGSSKDNTDVGSSRQGIEVVVINMHEKFKKNRT